MQMRKRQRPLTPSRNSLKKTRFAIPLKMTDFRDNVKNIP